MNDFCDFPRINTPGNSLRDANSNMQNKIEIPF